MNHSSAGPPPVADWRLRFGIVGLERGSLVVKRGDLLGTVAHPAVDSRVLHDALLEVGERFSYRDLREALCRSASEGDALEVIRFLKNEAQVVAAPFPEGSRSELLILSSDGGFLAESAFARLELAVVGRDSEQRDELSRLVRWITNRAAVTMADPAGLGTAPDAIILCSQGLARQRRRDQLDALSDAGRPWLEVAELGRLARAGPVFAVPRRSAVCHRCSELRLELAGLPTVSADVGVTRHFSSAAILGLYELLRLVAGPAAPTAAVCQAFVVDGDLTTHVWSVAPASACPRCGSSGGNERRWRPSRGADAAPYADSELRELTSTTARARLGAYLGPLEVMRSLHTAHLHTVAGIETCTVTAAFLHGGGFEDRSFVGVGCDTERAEIAGLARTLERLSLCRDGSEDHVVASARALGGQAVRPSLWGPELASWDETELSWVRGFSLVDGAPRMVPGSAVFFPYESVVGEGEVPWAPHHKGTGLGLSRSSAVLWALLELVETRAMARIDSLGLFGQEVDLDPLLDDPQIARLLSALASAGYGVAIRDCSLDPGLPVIAAVISTPGSSPRSSRGSCAHLCGAYAVRRALLEAVRNLHLLPGQTPGWRHLTEEGRAGHRSRVADLSRGTVDRDLDHVLAKLRGMTREIVVVDLTREWASGRRRRGHEVHCVRVIASHSRCRVPKTQLNPASTGNRAGQPTQKVDSLVCDLQLEVPSSPSLDPLPAAPQAEVVAVGTGVLADLVEARLRSLGWKMAACGRPVELLSDLDRGRARPGMVIAAMGESPASELADWNLEAHRRALPWIAFTQRGDDVECGPLVRGGGEPGCHRCWRLAVHRRLPVLADYEQLSSHLPPGAGGIVHGGARLAVERLLLDVARFLTLDAAPRLQVSRFTLDGRVVAEPWAPVAECPVCGAPSARTSG